MKKAGPPPGPALFCPPHWTGNLPVSGNGLRPPLSSAQASDRLPRPTGPGLTPSAAPPLPTARGAAGTPFLSCQKEKRAAAGPKRKNALPRSGAVALRADGGLPNRCRRNLRPSAGSRRAVSLHYPCAACSARRSSGRKIEWSLLLFYPQGTVSGSGDQRRGYPGLPRAEGFPKGSAFPSLTAARERQPSLAGGRRSACMRTDPPRHFFSSTGRGAFSF